LVYFVFIDTIQDIGQPFCRIHVVEFAGTQQRVDDSRMFSSFVISTEEVVFSALCWHEILNISYSELIQIS
jgi:hypothetical protein